MSVELIKQQLAAVRYPVSSSLSIPPRCYHDEEWLGREREQLFQRGWFAIGREDQWKVPGDYQSMTIVGIPIVVTMDREGVLKALSNVCLHRASQIMSGAGRCKALVCPFHGWSYDFTGQVISAPRMETARGFSATRHQLKQFHIETSDGFVFLNLGDCPPPLQDRLGDFNHLHAPWSLSDLVTARKREFAVNCNWKLFIEAFNEYYHLPYVHPDSINDRYPEPDPADVVMGEYTTQFGVTSGNPALLDGQNKSEFPKIPTLDDRQCTGTRYTWVYPNMTFAASYDCLWMYHVYPINAGKTHVVQTVCFPPETTMLSDFSEKARAYYDRFDTAIDEDIFALEKQQKGMRSPYAQQGRFSALEPGVGNFACWYAKKMRV